MKNWWRRDLRGRFLRRMAACFMSKGQAKRRNWPVFWRRLLAPCGNLISCHLKHCGATLAANQDMFLTLAKFRAIRLLWARVLEASGIAHRPLRLHGETSRRMMARLDPHKISCAPRLRVWRGAWRHGYIYRFAIFHRAGPAQCLCTAHGAQYAAYSSGRVPSLARG